MEKLPEAGVGVKLMILVLKIIFFIYDQISYVFWFVLKNPKLTMENSNRIKASPIGKELNTPFRDVRHFDSCTSTPDEMCSTVDEIFDSAVQKFGNNDLFGTREILSEEDETQPNGKVFKKMILGNYKWQSFHEVSQRMSNIGRGLLATGLKPRENVCLFAETRADWMIVFQSCCRFNIPVVTLYATLGDEAIAHGINESEVKYILTSFDLLPKLKNVQSKIPNVTHIVYMESPTGKFLKEENKIPGVTLFSLKTVENIGSDPNNEIFKVEKPSKDDLAVIMYTSGSTGVPKGVMLSHANLVAVCSGLVNRISNPSTKDTLIAYLPLAHVLELISELGALSFGIRIGYSSPLTLMEGGKIKKGCKGDLRALRPTIMAAVPAIMDRIYKGVYELVQKQGAVWRALFEAIYDYKKKKYLNGYDTPFFNRSILKLFRRNLGGKVRLLLCGGAPLSADTQLFMNIIFCCPVGQGYALTETCGGGTIQEDSDLSTGRVGHPISCCQILLKDWEEGNYTVQDKPNPRGEIWVGGNSIAMGYYKMPEKTLEDFTVVDGIRYFKTGDIGEIHYDGCLKIIDRKKDLVKLQAGEYVSLGKVESALMLSPYIEMICIYAESSKNYAIALLVPAKKKVEQLVAQNNLAITDFKEMCQNKIIKKEVYDSILLAAKKGNLQRFEIPQKIHICHEEWTSEKGLLTDAMKLKRKNIQAYYETEIASIYT